MTRQFRQNVPTLLFDVKDDGLRKGKSPPFCSSPVVRKKREKEKKKKKNKEKGKRERKR
jgi:hypothetical protein